MLSDDGGALMAKPKNWANGVSITIPLDAIDEIKKSLDKQNVKLKKVVLDLTVRAKGTSDDFTLRFVGTPKWLKRVKGR